MSAHSGDEVWPAVPGTSRRDLLRGGAIGMGAFVGAMALVNAQEVSSDAQQIQTGPDIFVGFSLFGVNKVVPVHSFSFGGDLDGSPSPIPAVLTLDANKFSPLLLKVYAEATALTKVVIKEYERNVQNMENLVTTITLTSSRITSFHTDVVAGASSGRYTRDTMQLTFGTANVTRADGGALSYTWTLPT